MDSKEATSEKLNQKIKNTVKERVRDNLQETAKLFKRKIRQVAVRHTQSVFLLVLCVVLVCLSVYFIFKYSTLPECLIQNVWSKKYKCKVDPKHPDSHPWQQLAYSHTYSGPDSKKIAVAMVVDNFFSPAMRNLTIANKQWYCDLHQYDLIVPEPEEVELLAEGFPAPWAKFPLILGLFASGYSHVFMIDADAVIMRGDIDLGIAAQELQAKRKFLTISTDFNGVNSGVFLIRNTEVAVQFLQEAWRSRLLLGKLKMHIPLRFENRAFFFLADMWPECPDHVTRIDSILAPQYEGDAHRFRQGYNLVSHCIMNTRPPAYQSYQDILAAGTSFDDIAHAFVVHAAGLRNQDKQHIIAALCNKTVC